MPREYKAFLRDILESIDKIDRYTKDINFQDFVKNELIQDAVIRNLEIIGEAVKNLPDDFKGNYPEIEWRKIAGLRDILIHAYFGIDLEIIWDIVQNKMRGLKKIIEKTFLNLNSDKE